MTRMEIKKDNNAYEVYHNISFFSDLPETMLKKLFDITKEIELKPGDYIIQEGEISSDFFIILDGNLEVIKYDEDRQHAHVISTLSKGQTIGEMAWLNNAPRSASVRAVTTARLLSTSFDDIQAIVDKEPGFYRVFKQISKSLSQRLQATDEFAIRALVRELRESKIRVSLGHFMINVIAALCLFAFSLTIMINYTKVVSSSTYLSVAFLFVMLIFFYLIKKSSELPLEFFGFTTQNWRVSIYEAIVFTIPLLLLITALKWLCIHTLPSYANSSLFDFYKSLPIHSSQFRTWAFSVTLYCLISVPFQEILTRGAMQAPLMEFLTGKNKLFLSILISNLIFSTMHLYLSLRIAFLVFVPGLYFGWLFGRHKNLIGVFVAHTILGGYALFFLGIGI